MDSSLWKFEYGLSAESREELEQDEGLYKVAKEIASLACLDEGKYERVEETFDIPFNCLRDMNFERNRYPGLLKAKETELAQAQENERQANGNMTVSSRKLYESQPAYRILDWADRYLSTTVRYGDIPAPTALLALRAITDYNDDEILQSCFAINEQKAREQIEHGQEIADPELRAEVEKKVEEAKKKLAEFIGKNGSVPKDRREER